MGDIGKFRLKKFSENRTSIFANIEISIPEHTTRRLFDWRDNPAVPPSMDYKGHHYDGLDDYQQQSEHYIEIMRLDNSMQPLCASKTFMAMLKDEEDISSVPVNFEYLKRGAASYSHIENQVRISNEEYNTHGGNTTAYTYLIAHEMRHAWQKLKGIFDDWDKMSAQSLLLLSRAYEADCATFQVAVCSDLDVLGDCAHWNILENHSAYRNVANAFLRNIISLEKSIGDQEWHYHLNNGEYADETGSALQAAFDAFFNRRGLKVSYDRYALNKFNDFNQKRKREICPKEDIRLLEEKIKILGSMPYINLKTGITQRPKYNPSVILEDRSDRFYQRIKEAPTLMRLKHVESRTRPLMRPTPKPLFS